MCRGNNIRHNRNSSWTSGVQKHIVDRIYVCKYMYITDFMVLLYYAVWRTSLSIALMSIAFMTWRQTKVVQFIVYCRSIRD